MTQPVHSGLEPPVFFAGTIEGLVLEKLAKKLAIQAVNVSILQIFMNNWQYFNNPQKKVVIIDPGIYFGGLKSETTYPCLFFLFTATIGANGVAAASPHSPMPNSSASKAILKETSGKETHFQTQGAVPWTYKAFKNALRTGGWLLSQAIKPFSKKTADWMDQGEKWTEKQFSKTLQKIGAPKDVADSLAKFMISLL